MRVRAIYYSSRFEKLFQKLPRSVQNHAVLTEKRFRENPFHPSLRTHQLHGKLNGLWSISITMNYRILFRSLGNGDILFVSIGTHSIYEP